MNAHTTLSDVTLVSITGVQVDAAHLSLQRCMADLCFARALLISTERPSTLDPRIRWIQIPPMTIDQYNTFILKHLYRYVDTTHVLIAQADGFVLNPQRWDPAWLEFDYIGAPWPERLFIDRKYRLDLRNRVGNGGFSLRSRRLLDLTSPIDFETMQFPTRNEDVVTCYLLYDYLLGHGVRFPEVEMAARFSIEWDDLSFGQTIDTAFGFHGRELLSRIRARGAAAP